MNNNFYEHLENMVMEPLRREAERQYRKSGGYCRHNDGEDYCKYKKINVSPGICSRCRNQMK